MTEVDSNLEVQEMSAKELQAAELKSLKAKADLMGLTYHPSIGLGKLKKKVTDKLEGNVPEKPPESLVEDFPVSSDTFASPDTYTRKRETVAARKSRLRKKASRLVRFRLTCMNPAKKGYPSEVFTVSNSIVGTFRRAIPYHAPSWHCERMMLDMLKNKEYLDFYEVKGSKGRMVKKSRMVKEFAIEELPPLNQKEINEIKERQASQNSLED